MLNKGKLNDLHDVRFQMRKDGDWDEVSKNKNQAKKEKKKQKYLK
jgi:hypothetical protein